MDNKTATFEQLGLRSSLTETMTAEGFAAPLEIQRRAIPKILAGLDVVGVSETGSGKTLAYGLAVFHRLKKSEELGHREKRQGRPQALIVTPTRELALQVSGVLKTLAHDTRLRVRLLIGGVERKRQRDSFAKAFEILVSTPGRLLRFAEEGRLHLSSVRMLVLDEADHLFEMGFLQELNSLLKRVPDTRQMLLFSATLPKPVEKILGERLKSPEIIRTKAAHKPVKNLRIEQLQVSNQFKKDELNRVLDRLKGRGLVFANSKARCQETAKHLHHLGHPIASLHSGLRGPERLKEIKRFRSGKARILVASDIAARGLDIDNVAWIVNFDLPKNPTQYLHRIGRTARVGQKGRVINFVTHRDAKMVRLLREHRVRKAPFELREKNTPPKKDTPGSPASSRRLQSHSKGAPKAQSRARPSPWSRSPSAHRSSAKNSRNSRNPRIGNRERNQKAQNRKKTKKPR